MFQTIVGSRAISPNVDGVRVGSRVNKGGREVMLGIRDKGVTSAREGSTAYLVALSKERYRGSEDSYAA